MPESKGYPVGGSRIPKGSASSNRVRGAAAQERGFRRERELRKERAIWAAALGVHLLFWVSLQTRWLCPLFNDTTHRLGPGGDFFALYQAGYSALHGASIYQYAHVRLVIPYTYPYRYLPIDAYTAGALLTLVPAATAYTLWLGLIELCLVRNVRLTYERSGGGVRGAALAAVWLGFTPFFAELWVGQFTFLLGSLLFWSVLAVEDGREREGMGLWIASVLWKPASLLWLPIWLRERRYGAGIALCGALLAANLAYFRFFPADWTVFAKTNLDPTPQWHAGNMGLSALLYNFTGPGRLFGWLRTMGTLGVVIPALVVTFRKPERPLWLLASIWTASYFLVYKDVWEHHLTLLLPFLVLSLWRAPSRWTLVWAVLLALPSPFVFYDPHWVGWYKADPQSAFSPGISLLHHAWRVVPVAALYGGWLRIAWIASPHPPAPPRARPSEASLIHPSQGEKG